MATQLVTMRRISLLLGTFVILYMLSFSIMIKKECYRFCDGEFEKRCLSSKLAVLVYRDEIPVDDMLFLHRFQPRIPFPQYIYELLTGQYHSEECSMDKHFPNFATFAPQQSCAIVGNGGVLTKSGCGEEIDAHDFVMRINLAPIKGHVVDVGNRVNLTMLNFETLGWLHGNLTQKEVGYPQREEYVRRIRNLNDSVLWYAKSMDKSNTREDLLRVAHVVRDVYRLPVRLAYSWKPISIEKYWHIRQYATSGFNAYVIARTFCTHISLYGFYPFEVDDKGFRITHHYFNDEDFSYRGKVHNFVAEFKQLQDKEKQGELRLVTKQCSKAGGDKLKWRQTRNDTFVNPIFWFRIPKLIS